MDALDRKIVDHLRKDARASYSDIAESLNVVEGTVRKRVAKLFSLGIIQNFTLNLSLDYEIAAVVGVRTNPHARTEHVAAKLKRFGARDAWEVAGRYDVILYITAPSMLELNALLERIRTTKDVLETECFTVLKRA